MTFDYFNLCKGRSLPLDHDMKTIIDGTTQEFLQPLSELNNDIARKFFIELDNNLQ